MTTNFGRNSCLLMTLTLGLGLAGCEAIPNSSRADQDPVTTQGLSQAQMARARGAQRLQAGDKARIVVFGEDKMSAEHEIDANGNIAMPLIGSIHAAGLTRGELEQAVAGRLKSGQILRNPVVTVSVMSTRPFYVLGEVEKPGEYTFHSGLNVMSAAAVAGGFTYRASKTRVMIKRAGETGFTEYQLSPDIPIQPGDLISVPERYF